MPLVVEVVSDKAVSRTVVGKRDNKSYTFITQEARVGLNGEVRKLEIQLGPEQAPYPIGKYVIGDGSFRVNNYAALTLGDRLQLVPLSQSGALK